MCYSHTGYRYALYPHIGVGSSLSILFFGQCEKPTYRICTTILPRFSFVPISKHIYLLFLGESTAYAFYNEAYWDFDKGGIGTSGT